MIETDVTLLLGWLNTTPVVDGRQRDELADAEAGRWWLAAHGQVDSADEWRAVVAVRSALKDVVRGAGVPASLARWVGGVHYDASLVGDGLTWTQHDRSSCRGGGIPASRQIKTRDR